MVGEMELAKMILLLLKSKAMFANAWLNARFNGAKHLLPAVAD